MKLTIGYFYKENLNLYGDNGNVEILKYRAEKRGISVEVVLIDKNTPIKDVPVDSINLVFMGGGPDSGQKEMYLDLLEDKKVFLEKYVAQGGVGLFVCGSYQLLGNYYKAADGSVLKGLNIFDMYTEHFGVKKPRCIGNVVCKLAPQILEDTLFKKLNYVGESLVGFENHGGRTYLGSGVSSLGQVQKGFGNNGEDYTEGIIYKNCFGTYLHGPVLAKNPHFADWLIAKALKVEELPALEKGLEDLILAAHLAAQNLKQ